MEVAIDCPCCGFLAEAEDEGAARSELREHVLWTHYRSNDWGAAPSPLAALGLFLHLGILTHDEANSAARRIYRETVPRPGWLISYGPFLAGALLFMALGVLYGYQWGRFGNWWSPLSGLFALALMAIVTLVRHRRRWSGHKTANQLEAELFHVPDHLPEEFDQQADESR